MDRANNCAIHSPIRPTHTPPAIYGDKLYFATFNEGSGGFGGEYRGRINVVDKNTGEYLPEFPVDISVYEAEVRQQSGKDYV